MKNVIATYLPSYPCIKITESVTKCQNFNPLFHGDSSSVP